MFRKIVILTSTLILWISCFAEAKSNVKVLRLAHGLNTKHPVHKGMVYMAEQVEKKSGGKIKVQIFPNEQLGNEKECLESVQLGYLAMTKVSSGVMEGFVPEFKIFGIPYLFRDSEHFWAVCNGPIGKELLAAGEPKRLKGLCYYDAGARSFYAKKPINSPEDLKGGGEPIQVRVMNSPMSVEMISTMGGGASTMPWGELYSALDQGVIDAAENNPPSLMTSRHYEICNYYSLDEHTRLPDILIISTRVWAGLTSEQQRILREAIEESVEYQRKIWKESEEESYDVFIKKGVQIIYPDKEPFIKAVQPMWDKYKKDSLGMLIERIVQVK